MYFDQIHIQKPQAAELISLLAELDRQGILKALLCGDDEGEIEIITALGALQAFSLVNKNREGEAFEMERLVQFSILKWLEMHNVKLIWQEKALRLLSANFPNGKVETWETCGLVPYIFRM